MTIFENKSLMTEEEIESIPSGDYTPIPVGDYTACLIHIGDKDNPNQIYTKTKNGDGDYLFTIWEVVDEGPYKGRKIFERTTNKKYGNTEKDRNAERRGHGIFSRYCRALGFTATPSSPSQLLNRPPVKITVKINPASNGYGPSNSITNWKSLIPQTPQQYQQPSATQTQPDPFTPEAQPPAQQPVWAQNNQQGGW